MNRSAAIASVPESRATTTLLELVSEISATGATDREVVAVVMDLVEKGCVRLIGQICAEDLLAS